MSDNWIIAMALIGTISLAILGFEFGRLYQILNGVCK